MPISSYPSGFDNGVLIRGIPMLNLYPGNIWWVDSVNGGNGNRGTFTRPFASLDYATGRATAGDIIIAKAGHVETISAAGSLTCDTAGVCYVFLGQGSNKAYLNFTATAGTVLITAANVTFVNPRIVAGIDAVVSGIVVQAADFTINNMEDFDAAAKAITIGVLTTSSASRLCIDGYRYHASTTGTQKTERIKTVGALDHIQLYNLDITGDFSNACVNMANAACTNVDLKNFNLNNLNSGPKPGLSLHANTSGWAEDVKIRVASGTTYVDSLALMQWGPDCIGYNTDGSGGASLGSATDVEAKVESVGVQTSTVQSKIDSVGITASTVSSKTDSVGVQASAVTSTTGSIATGVSNILSTAQSVGLQASTISTATSTIDSKVGSVGLTASTNTSTLGSVAGNVSAVRSVVLANAASIASVGVQTSAAAANVLSVATQTSQISTAASTAASVGGANAASIASVGAQASTINSVVGANAASVASVGTQASVINSVVAANAASVASVGTQVSTVNSVVGANAASIASVGTLTSTTTSTLVSRTDSVGTTASTTVSKTESVGVATSEIQSVLASLALIISTINSKT